ncbi:hypothetical protein KI387_018830, partial [Taxus chinensis]
ICACGTPFFHHLILGEIFFVSYGGCSICIEGKPDQTVVLEEVAYWTKMKG